MSHAYLVDTYKPSKTINTVCAVCNAETPTELVKRENNLNIVKCEVCDFIFVNPKPSLTELDRFYQSYYPKTVDIPEAWEREMGDIFRESRDMILRYKQGGDILDIGCSFGFFLQQFSAGEWSRYGVEPSSTAVDYLVSTFTNIRVDNCTFEDASYGTEAFDAVTAFYVLEHVIDPRGFVQKVFDLLKPGGIAIIRIPYSRPFYWAGRLLGRPFLQAPMHLSDFSPRHMEIMCLELGFDKVECLHKAHRNSSDFIEMMGARVMSFIGAAAEKVAADGYWFPYYGAYSYFLSKPVAEAAGSKAEDPTA